DIAAKLAEISVNLERKVVEGERLYGSVTAGDIAEAITKAGVKISRAQVQLDEPIKQLGVYTVAIKVFSDVEAQVKVWVVAEKA
ncbi:MAG: 50S ribosomal protein L9, partial [Fibrobacter sp.]|nr:50S ribosomal protein L9 [Fibrobacter sp.]